MKLLGNIGLLAVCRADGPQDELHAVPSAALAWEDGVIEWAGPEAELPAEFRRGDLLDAGGRLVVPGLVDCHTHLAFGGWRADEFARRARGESYLDIARSGGGIASTVRQTRAAADPVLLTRAEAFLQGMVSLGVTTVECKSGYGLDRETELRVLGVYRQLAERQPVRLVPTYLGAHVVPPEYRERREDYIALVMEMIAEVARRELARCCDVFVESSAFSVDEARRILAAAREHGLGAKLHADQLTAGGGAELAAEVGAWSADHLEHASEAGIAAMASAGVVAVSLPLATLYLRQPPMPARRFLDAGVSVAVATDFNPGSGPSWHLPLAMTLACTMQGMTPAEALAGATIVAARAVGLADRLGSLEPGKAADFAIIDAPDVDHWLYHFRPNACLRTVIAGRTVWRAAR